MVSNFAELEKRLWDSADALRKSDNLCCTRDLLLPKLI
jgi:hypothetical protein